MTRRSIFIGLLVTMGLASWCYVSDHVIRAGDLVGNLMPVAVFGALVAFLLFRQAASKGLGGRELLSPRELVVALALFLCACAIPGRFTQCMPSSIMLPYHDLRLKPGWQQEQILELVPERMLPDISSDESRTLNGFITGLGTGDKHISFSDVPWSGWKRPLLFWVPLMVIFTLATAGMAIVFHRQWSQHEQLPYPISVFTHALVADDDQNGGRLFRNRLFWIGCLVVFLIELNNYGCRWWPNILIPVTLRFDFSGIAPHLPTLMRGKGMTLLHPRILFPVVGLSYFLASDVCLSMVVGPFIYCTIAGIFAAYGVVLRPGREMALSLEGFFYSGGYFGILMMFIYTGRHYYWHVLRRSVCAKTEEEVPEYAIWGMRVFLCCSVLVAGMLWSLGLGLPLAIMYTFFALMVFAVVSRVMAETGAFMIGTFVFPGVLLWGFFGAVAIGPESMVTMFVLSTVLMLIPGRSPMPFLVQALKLVDMSEVSKARTARWGLAAIVLAFALAIPLAIYWQYDHGTPSYGWPRKAATYPFENTVEAIHKLKAQGLHEQAVKADSWTRLTSVKPSWNHVSAFVAAALLAIGFGVGRLFFRRWPFHPVIFVFLGGFAAMHMAFSFLIGWMIKSAATKYGGANLYQRLKPLMIGLIAGAMLGKFVPIVVGTVAYLIFGRAAV